MIRRDTLNLIAKTVMLASASTLFSACGKGAIQLRGVDVTGADYAKDLALPDQNGRPRSLKDFAGKVVVVFFGYTQCPDFCPTTLSELVQVKQALGKDGSRLQVLFVTVDPARDTAQLLRTYMANFDPAFLALRGTPEQTAAVAKDFKVYFKKAEGVTAESYTMDHSVGSYIFDPAGRLRVYSRYGSGVEALTADVKALLQEAG